MQNNKQTLINVASKSAANLHQIFASTTFNAPMSYFDSTDNSVILNRFSQDMTLIESVLPMMTWLVLMSEWCLVSFYR